MRCKGILCRTEKKLVVLGRRRIGPPIVMTPVVLPFAVGVGFGYLAYRKNKKLIDLV